MQGIEELFCVKDVVINIDNFIEKFMSSRIYIYGAGNAGRMTYDLLKGINIEPEAFVDMNADNIISYKNRPVFRADDLTIRQNIDESSIVILSFLCDFKEFEHIKKRFLNLGYRNLYYFHEIYNIISIQNYMEAILGNCGFNKDCHKLEKQKILHAAKLFADEKSKKTYEDFIKAMFTLNFNLFLKPDAESQYFVKDICFNKGYSHFIDCGAYDGDTAVSLFKCKGKVDKIVLFEPELDNFKKLRANLNTMRVGNEQILFPCGVWKQTEMLKFKSGIQGSSTISSQGDIYVQCIALDDVLRDFAPTFIKMDIEGAEYEALLGAKNIIREYSPDLAISVYHKVEHIWSIPLLLKDINTNYRFYLRSHGLYGMETILYAVCEA